DNVHITMGAGMAKAPRLRRRGLACYVNNCRSGAALARREHKGPAPASRLDQPVPGQVGQRAPHRIPADPVMLGEGRLRLQPTSPLPTLNHSYQQVGNLM